MRTQNLFLAVTVTLVATAFNAAAQAQTNEGYWTSNTAGAIWKNPSGSCFRAGYWTPAMANSECDPDLVLKAAPPVAPAPAAAPAAPSKPAQLAPPPKPVVINLAATELFEFNKATLTQGAKAKLDSEVLGKLKEIHDIRFINVSGHTDRLGSAQYNQKLSEKRAEAVKAYLVSRGADASKIETYGFGKTMPVKACPDRKNRKALIECLAPNRRVVVEIQGGPR